MKKDGSALIGRLRKLDLPDASEEEVAKAERQPRKPKEPKKESDSILTPSYMIAAESKNVMLQCELTNELRDRLPSIQAQVSPFSAPLTLSKLVDLIYCEVLNSQTLRDRMQAQTSKYSIVLKRKNRTSLTVPEYISDYLQAAFGAGSQKSFTVFITWIVRDWDFIQGKMKMKGIPPDSPMLST